MDSFVIFCKEILTNYPFIATLFAFFGGLVASFSPCSLSSIPLILGYIGKGKSKNQVLNLTILFVLGNSIVFVLLGIFSTYLSVLNMIVGKWWYLVLSFILILMVLELWQVTHIFNSKKINASKKGWIGAFTTGAISAVMASPCSTPILIIILTLASTKSALYGAILLLYYAIGHNTLALLTVIANNKISKIKKNKKYKSLDLIVNIIFGIIILFLAFYFYYLGI